MRILIIDESATMRVIMKNLLKGFAFTEIAEAADVDTALAELQTGRFDLAIVDSKVATADRLELTRFVKTDPRLRELRTLLIAAGGARGIGARASATPRHDCIVRPFTSRTLKKHIEALVEPRDIVA